jgi:ubiquitin C-terminal hydrolase
MKQRPWFSEARMQFYRKLHNATKLTRPVKRRFHPEIACFMIWPEHRDGWYTDELPVTWGTPNCVAKLDEVPDQLILTSAACHTWKTHLGWQISRMLAKDVGDVAWKLHNTQIFVNVQRIGDQLGVPDNTRATSDMEAEWRAHCSLAIKGWMAEFTQAVKLTKSKPPRSRGRSVKPAAEVAGNVARFAAPAKKNSCHPPSSPPTDLRDVTGPGFVGLANLGNTCYVNAVVQVLVHLDPVNHYFAHVWPGVAKETAQVPPGGNGMAHAYAQLLADMEQGSPGSYVSPNAFLAFLYQTSRAFVPKGIFDAAEFMDSLLGLLDTDLVVYNQVQPKAAGSRPPGQVKGLPRPAQSVFRDVFRAEVQTRFDCEDCRRATNVRDFFLVVSVPGAEDTPHDRSIIELTEGLLAQARGSLHPDEACRTGPHRGRVHVSRAFVTLPPVLIFQILLPKRLEFGRDPQGDLFFEDVPPLRFPDDLDMAPYVVPESQEPMVYHLKAVVRHFPEGAGHFKAYVRINGSRYCFDDRLVTTSDWGPDDQHVSLLIYERPERFPEVMAI